MFGKILDIITAPVAGPVGAVVSLALIAALGWQISAKEVAEWERHRVS